MPTRAAGLYAGRVSVSVHLPGYKSCAVQTEELQLLCSLGREAAEILWEMAALQEETNATKEMLEKGELLQVCWTASFSMNKFGDFWSSQPDVLPYFTLTGTYRKHWTPQGVKLKILRTCTFQAQLRGMIGDYNRGDETILAAALEVFDLLSNTLAEYQTAMSPRAGAGATPAESTDIPSSGKLNFGIYPHEHATSLNTGSSVREP